MSIAAGVDIGSTHTKAALLVDGELAGTAIRRTGFRPARRSRRRARSWTFARSRSTT